MEPKNDKCMETVQMSAVGNKATGYMKNNPNERSHAMEADCLLIVRMLLVDSSLREDTWR